MVHEGARAHPTTPLPPAETTKDTDAIALYKVMKDTLVYLTHLDTMVRQRAGSDGVVVGGGGCLTTRGCPPARA